MIDTAALVSLATSVPPHQFHQTEILEAARSVMAERYPEFESLSSLFANTGIRHRYGVKPMEWYPSDAAGRSAHRLSSKARKSCLSMSRARRWRVPISRLRDIDTVVTVCSTGIATPTLEARVAGKLGFRADVSRVPVFGLGCAGGVSGLSIASRLAQARPGTNVLLVALELCTLAVRHDELTKANVVAASLFGDGAAAVILRAGDGGATRIEATGEKLWPDTLDIMGWSVDPEGFGVDLPADDSRISSRENMGPAVAEILPGWSFRWTISTASSAIPAAPKSSSRSSGRCRSIRARSITNARSSPTTATCRHPPCSSCSNARSRAGLPPRSLLTALGPGFTASCVALRHAA